MLWRQVVESQCQLLVFVVTIIVVVAEVGLFLCCHHAPHQFHGRIVLPAIPVAPGFYSDFCQFLPGGFQRDVQLAPRLAVDRDDA